jgi:hypothetical protein
MVQVRSWPCPIPGPGSWAILCITISVIRLEAVSWFFTLSTSQILIHPAPGKQWHPRQPSPPRCRACPCAPRNFHVDILLILCLHPKALSAQTQPLPLVRSNEHMSWTKNFVCKVAFEMHNCIKEVDYENQIYSPIP